MTHPALRYVSRWYGWIPFAAALVLAFAWGQALGTIGVLLVSVSLVGAVLTAVHHAEVVAHRVGEPFGTLILALAVTVIEAALVVSMILSGGAGAAGGSRIGLFPEPVEIVRDVAQGW